MSAKKPSKDVSALTIESAQTRILMIVKGLLDRYEAQLGDQDHVVKPKDLLDALRLAREVEEFDTRFQSVQRHIQDLKRELTILEDRMIGMIEK